MSEFGVPLGPTETEEKKGFLEWAKENRTKAGVLFLAFLLVVGFLTSIGGSHHNRKSLDFRCPSKIGQNTLINRTPLECHYRSDEGYGTFIVWKRYGFVMEDNFVYANKKNVFWATSDDFAYAVAQFRDGSLFVLGDQQYAFYYRDRLEELLELL